MIKGSKEYLDDVARYYVCSEHQTRVVVAWHATENSYILRCGQGEYPEEVTRQLSLTEMHKVGEDLPEPIKSNIEKGRRQRTMQQGKQTTAMTFQGVPATDLATGELLSFETVKALVTYAEKYRLDPYRGHVVLMYGKPYITLDGYLYYARQQHIPFTLSSRPVELTERTKYMVNEGDHVWFCEVRMTESKESFGGLGIVTKEEMTAKSSKDTSKLRSPVVAAHPWQLAQKRAEWQALRRAFPIGETEGRGNEAGDKSSVS